VTRKPFEHSEETQAWAALYSLGSLSGEEKTLYEQHLQEGCSDCVQEIQTFRRVVENLSLSAPLVIPSANARERLLASLGGRNRAPVPGESESSTRPKGVLLQQPGLLIARSSEMPWETVAPGIDRRVLFVDSDRDYITTLVLVQAGTRYPSHRHAGVEEILLLEGDLHVHGIVLHPGDYCRAEPDSVHEVTFSESGCMLLLRTSQHDEIRT